MLLSRQSEDRVIIDRFKLYGERCSGTDYARKLIEANLPGLELERNGAWETYKFVSPAVTMDRQVAIVVLRDAFDWIRALHKSPHLVGEWAMGIKMAEFMRHEWSSVLKHAQDAQSVQFSSRTREVMFERHP